MSRAGKLIVFEGVDGVGKSTLAQKFVDHLNTLGISCEYFAFPGREPGTLGYHVYMLHHELASFGIKSIASTSLQILHIAAHIDAIERAILPALESGRYVVLDRFWWSTWVYGIVNGVHRHSLKTMLDLELIHWGKTLPTIAFLISRSKPLRDDVIIEHWKNLSAGYLKLAEREGKKYRVEVINNETTIEKALDNLISITNPIHNGFVSND